jgi:MFS superfamily sulfate permease-like transporter
MHRTRWSDVGHDAVAATVVTTLVIPAGMGYAEAAGLPAITGLHATSTTSSATRTAAGIPGPVIARFAPDGLGRVDRTGNSDRGWPG